MNVHKLVITKTFAGNRNHDGNVYNMGDNAYLWSSSPVDDNAHGLNVDPNNVNANKNDNRANAHSVRCFKHSSVDSKALFRSFFSINRNFAKLYD